MEKQFCLGFYEVYKVHVTIAAAIVGRRHLGQTNDGRMLHVRVLEKVEKLGYCLRVAYGYSKGGKSK